MNLVEAMKDVLKNKTHIFTEYWKEDIKLVLEEVSRDFYRMVVSGKNTFTSVKRNGVKFTLRDIKDTGKDLLLIFKVLPRRVKDGMSYFKDDLYYEIENQPDQKHKTLFCLKVLGALTSFTVGTIYQIKRGKTEFNLKGLKNRNVITQFIFAEILFKLSFLFLVRFLGEIEKNVTSHEEREHIHYFRQLLSRRPLDEDSDLPLEPCDASIQIIENLKIYIMTGERA